MFSGGINPNGRYETRVVVVEVIACHSFLVELLLATSTNETHCGKGALVTHRGRRVDDSMRSGCIRDHRSCLETD